MQRRLCISPDLVLDRITMQHLHLFVERLRPFIEAVSCGINAQEDFRTTVLQAAKEYPSLAECFEISEREIETTFGLRPEYLFPGRDEIHSLTIRNRTAGRAFTLMGENDIDTLGRMFALFASGDHTERKIREEVSDESFEKLVAFGAFCESRGSRLRVPRAPGIVRLQHASLLYRTATTGILVDPLFNSYFEGEDVPWTFTASDLQGLVDGILISHSHEDHWSPTSLMFFPRNLPIIVPHVPRLNLLAHDMASQLKDFGFTNVITPDWYSSPITIGDFQIHALPFYGEQPLRTEKPRSPHLRNWGNTYLLKTPSYSSWFLIDSGDDPSGRMSEVAEYVVSQYGGVDFLLSSLQTFRVGRGCGSPWYATENGHYWLSLTAEQMARFPSIQETVTLAAEGVAEVARIARAKRFMPYAHWWAEPGTMPTHDSNLSSELQRYTDRLKTRLDIHEWNIGDGYFLMKNDKVQKLQCW